MPRRTRTHYFEAMYYVMLRGNYRQIIFAEMNRLGILKEGYIYPCGERGTRDLLRKRSQLIQQRTRACQNLR